MRNKNLRESFSHAFDGFSHVLWTQPHVRIQLLMVLLVFILSYIMHLKTTDVLFVLSAVAFVLVTELVNTAIEVVVNMVTETYHPLAKIAKDVAAAAVLMASTYAVLVGGAIFFNKQSLIRVLGNTPALEHLPSPHPVVVILVGIAVVSIIVALGKTTQGHGSILRGGAVSGHTAVSFLLAGTIALYSKFNPLISVLAVFLAILVAQSRVEGKIHTLREVFLGAVVAMLLLALLIFFAK